MCSSGTTGQPKGVVLTHNNLVSNLVPMILPEVGEYDKGNDILLGLLPIFHIAGLSVFGFVNTIVGATTVTMPKMDSAVLLNVFRTHKFTKIHFVPPLLNLVATNPAFTKTELESICTIICGAAATPPHFVHRLLEKTGRYTLFQEAYGMTETSGVSLMIPPDSKNTKISSVGTVIPSVECKVIDVETGDALGSNKNGELCFRGEQVMQGYLDNEEATRNTIDEDGWLHTGDIGYYDEQEHFYIVGRTKELIKVKGLQVAPSELEDVLGKHPKIVDVAVIGVPDDRSGELPRAYVVRKDTALTAEDINKYLEDKVSEHKKLKGGIEFIETIPKSAAGKILRKELQLLYKNKY